MELVKRLARNTRNLNDMLDTLESAQDFVHDAAPLTKDMMTEATTQLGELERKGYFGFVRQGMYVMDQVVTSFGEEDVKQLGDNVVLILNTVKALTQPEMMNHAQQPDAGLPRGGERSAGRAVGHRHVWSAASRCATPKCGAAWPSPWRRCAGCRPRRPEMQAMETSSD